MKGNLFKCYDNILPRIFSSVNLTIHFNKIKGNGLSGSYTSTYKGRVFPGGIYRK